MANGEWECPYCQRFSMLNDRFSSGHGDHVVDFGAKEGALKLYTWICVCPNPDCKQTTIIASLHQVEIIKSRSEPAQKQLLHRWNLLPRGLAKAIPEYVPQPIRDDYTEAANIVDLSPKASATLARRCLQGMIRDFWGISKNRLVDEIEELQDKIDTETWDEIDALRKLGNVGAHMERDIGLIIDVEPKEAMLLINLIEDLIRSWYVQRHERQQRRKHLVEAVAENDQLKQAAKKA